MAKTGERIAADKQPESQRGKSRFGVQPRSNRVVLPDRPPREIDNEIVSILLGGDPSSLSIPNSPTVHSPLVTSPMPSVVASPVEDRQPEENLDVATTDSLSEVESVLPLSEKLQIQSNASQTRISPVLETPTERLLSTVENLPSVAIRGISGQKASLPRTDVRRTPKVPAENVQEPPIASFEEFAERWRHGLRKGQLKVCEVLYQKTHALGETECTTSFSELGRLSGLQMRQCFNIIAQLEALRFIERAKSEIATNKKDQGSVIRFHLFPKS